MGAKVNDTLKKIMPAKRLIREPRSPCGHHPPQGTGEQGGGEEPGAAAIDVAALLERKIELAGMRVGVYNFSGAFLWESFFRERPEAEDWVDCSEMGWKEGIDLAKQLDF